MHPAEAYIDGVLSGRIAVCRFVRLAVERHVDDLKTGPARGLYFDPKAARHVIDFFRYLRHSKGEWAGKPFELSPFQQFLLWVVFGWYKDDGTRRFREVYEEIPRKNGKSTKLAGVGNYLFLADGEPGAEIYAAATKRDQAKIAFDEAERMIKASPMLLRRVTVHRNNMHSVAAASKFQPLGADADGMDGLNVHGAIIDELHAHKTRDVADLLDTATGARRQPLVWYITTAGTNRESICWEKREYTRKILLGQFKDDTFFGIIYTIDLKVDWPELQTADEARRAPTGGPIEDQWDDERAWYKANPNLGVSCKLDDLRRKAAKAKETPGYLNTFLNKHLDIWTSQVTRWMPMPAWDANGAPFKIEDLLRRECYAGLDLAATTDLCALSLIFPFGADFRVLPFFWIPEDNMKERVRRDKVPYDVWVREGLVTATPGNIVDYDAIVSKLEDLRKLYDIREVAYDRWGAPRIMKMLTDRKFELVPFGQGFASMSGPTKELMNLVLQGRFHHGGNPVLRWNADNVVTASDPSGNIKPNKAKSTMRIDGVVASIMGLDRATRHEGGGPSVYETRGLLTL